LWRKGCGHVSGTLWAYQGNPFGEQQPTSSAGYVLNLRYSGQYYDAESGTNYNVNRNYEPAVGRYQQSDPIGLRGGISTYAYVSGNPLSHRDPLGMNGLGDMQGAFCPGNLCTLPQDMIQNSWGAPNMAPVYIMDGAAIAASGGLALPFVSDAALPVIANTLLAANVLTGAIELPEAIVTGAAPTEEVLSDDLDYIIESFETPPPPQLPVPTQPVAAPLAVPAGNQTRCPQ
jgi:RHS repeat-associated protein